MKKAINEIKTHKNQYILIALCWLVYTFAYTGRYSLNANINLIMSDYGVSHARVGLCVTCFFFSYGAGQMINGIFCKKYNLKLVFPIALILSAIINMLVFVGVGFTAIPILWLINGFVQSFLWSSLIRALSQGLDEFHLNKAIIVMSTTTPAGTLITYGLSSLFVKFNNYRLSFLFGMIAMLTVAFLWIIGYKGNVKGETAVQNSDNQLNPEKQNNKKMGLFILIPICLALFAVLDNFIKDGIQTWVPAILKETFAISDEYSILLTLLLPMIGILSSVVTVKMKQKVSDFVTMCAIFFLTTGIMIGGIILLGSRTLIGVLVLFSLVELCMHGVNNVITNMAPLFLRDKVNSGMFAGVMNCCCYVGSTFSSIGLGAITDSYGWEAVFGVMSAGCIVALVIYVVYKVYGGVSSRKNTDLTA